MLILDTDHCSEYLRGSEEGTRLRVRLSGQPSATTIITLEEQARGWLSRIRQARTGAETIFGYGRLHRLFAFTRDWIQECKVGQPSFKATRRMHASWGSAL